MSKQEILSDDYLDGLEARIANGINNEELNLVKEIRCDWGNSTHTRVVSYNDIYIEIVQYNFTAANIFGKWSVDTIYLLNDDINIKFESFNKSIVVYPWDEPNYKHPTLIG